MVYFVTFAIIIAVSLLLLLAINIIYGFAFSYLIRGGLKEDYLLPKKKVLRCSVFTIAVLCVFAIGISRISIENSCVGMSAREAFDMYARQSGFDGGDYEEKEGGDFTFFVCGDSGEGGEWYVYKKTSMYYSRVFNAATYYHYYNMNKDGSYGGLAASVAEIETDEGYFYFMKFFDGSIFNRVDEDEVFFNGDEVELEFGTMICSQNRLSTLALSDGENIKNIDK